MHANMTARGAGHMGVCVHTSATTLGSAPSCQAAAAVASCTRLVSCLADAEIAKYAECVQLLISVQELHRAPDRHVQHAKARKS